MNELNETRHIVMYNEEAVLSTNESIQSDEGTNSDSFTWVMFTCIKVCLDLCVGCQSFFLCMHCG